MSDLEQQYIAEIEEIRQRELVRALKALESGVDPNKVASKLAHGLTSKIIHAPTQGLKNLAASDPDEALKIAKEILGIT